MNAKTPPQIPLPAHPYVEERFQLRPIEGPCHPFAVLENLLRQPGRILSELRHGRAALVASFLLLILVFCLAIYGVVVGSLSGGAQLWVAPLKLALGSIVAGLICLPSLYIFLCLSGVDAHLRQVATTLLAAICLTWLLLIGLAPVAWVFSQSTDSIGLMAFLHLIFWGVALSFGFRLLAKGMGNGSPQNQPRLAAWMVIYTIVCLQMMTTLRPIVGVADTFLPTQKQFFVAHALKVIGGEKE